MNSRSVRDKSHSHSETGIPDQVSVERQWTSANNRLNKAIDSALQTHPHLQSVDVPRHLKLGAIYYLSSSLEARISGEEFLRAIQTVIRLEAWISKAVCVKNPNSVSREMVAWAAIDIDWMAAQLERLFAQTTK